MLERLPTKMELAKRGVAVATHNLVRPLCFIEEEDA